MILNIFIYKILDGRHRSLTITIKFVIGMFLASMTMFMAGGVEVRRQNHCPGGRVLHEEINHLLIYSIF